MPSDCYALYMSIKFGVDSSSRFPLERGHTDTHNRRRHRSPYPRIGYRRRGFWEGGQSNMNSNNFIVHVWFFTVLAEPNNLYA